MTPEEKEIYDYAVKSHISAENEQYNKDRELLTNIKKHVSKELFEEIEFQIKESENPSNYKIITKPIGNIEHDPESEFCTWIEQTGGETGDNYSGTVCIEICDNKYLMWDFWM